MLDLLYFVLIAPLELLMSGVFHAGLFFVHSHGFALIVMSFVVNMAILPIYNIAEHWQRQECALKESMRSRESMLRQSFSGQERFAMISTLYRQCGYDRLMPLRASVGLLLQVPFFFAAYHLLSGMTELQGRPFLFLADLGSPDSLLDLGGFSVNLLPIVMTAISLLSAHVYAHELQMRDKLQLCGMALLFLLLLYNSPAALTLYWTLNCIFSLGKNLVEKAILPCCQKKHSKFKKIAHHIKNEDGPMSIRTLWHGRSDKLYWPSVILISALVFVYFPFRLYFSDVNALDLNSEDFVHNQILFFEAAIIVWLILWLSLSGLIRSLFAIFMATGAIGALLFGFVVSPDYGALNSAFALQHEELLFQPGQRIWDIALLFCVLAMVVFLLNFAKQHLLVIFLHLVSCACVLIPVMQFAMFSLEAQKKDEVQAQSEVPPENVQKLFRFSKNGKNIVVIMLDAFTGGHIAEIIARHPEMAHQLDGFIWYKDTLSAGAGTIFGKPVILGGYPAHPINSNQESGRSIEDKVNKSWGMFFSELQEKNFEISIAEKEFLDAEKISQCLKTTPNLITKYQTWNGTTELWKKENPISVSISKNPTKWFPSIIGFFHVMPRGWKKGIYREGNWLHIFPANEWGFMRALRIIAELSSYPHLSDSSGNGDTFKFLVNEITHIPWQLDEGCRPCLKNGGGRNPSTGIYDNHLQTEICALKSLAAWFGWMKKHHVYDNTQIIVVSDHGAGDSGELVRMWSGLPFSSSERPYPGAPDALLLIKNIGEHGLLRKNEGALMATWDIPSLVSKSLGETVQQPWDDENRERCHVVGTPLRYRHPSDVYKFDEIWCITGSMFTKKNWRKVQ